MKVVIIIVIQGVLFSSYFAEDDRGKILFKNECENCHALFEEKLGPPLACINNRLEKGWVHKWLKDSDQLIKEGDIYAIELRNKYKIQHPQVRLSESDITDILHYLKVQCDTL